MVDLTMAEAKEVYRFLQTLDTCEYLGVPPQFDEVTSDDLSTIANAIYNYIIADGGNPYV